MRTARSRRGRFTPPHKPIIYKAPRGGGALINEQLPRYDVRDAYQVVVLATGPSSREACGCWRGWGLARIKIDCELGATQSESTS